MMHDFIIKNKSIFFVVDINSIVKLICDAAWVVNFCDVSSLFSIVKFVIKTLKDSIKISLWKSNLISSIFLWIRSRKNGGFCHDKDFPNEKFPRFLSHKFYMWLDLLYVRREFTCQDDSNWGRGDELSKKDIELLRNTLNVDSRNSNRSSMVHKKQTTPPFSQSLWNPYQDLPKKICHFRGLQFFCHAKNNSSPSPPPSARSVRIFLEKKKHYSWCYLFDLLCRL